MPATGSETRDRILTTARCLFHARGYNDVGVNDICAEARVVKGSFYHFFPTKEDLLHAVLERGLAQGDLTRRGLVQTAEDLGPIDVGFQRDRTALATLDPTSPTGLQFLLWAED